MYMVMIRSKHSTSFIHDVCKQGMLPCLRTSRMQMDAYIQLLLYVTCANREVFPVCTRHVSK